MMNGEFALNSAALSLWFGHCFLIAARAASSELRFVTSQAKGAAWQRSEPETRERIQRVVPQAQQ